MGGQLSPLTIEGTRTEGAPEKGMGWGQGCVRDAESKWGKHLIPPVFPNKEASLGMPEGLCPRPPIRDLYREYVTERDGRGQALGGALCGVCGTSFPMGPAGETSRLPAIGLELTGRCSAGSAPFSVGVFCPLLDCSGGNTFPAGNGMEQKRRVAQTAQHPVAFLRPQCAGPAVGQADSGRTPASLTSCGPCRGPQRSAWPAHERLGST